MKQRIFRYFKHLFVTLIVLIAILVPIGLYHGATLSYGDNPLRLQLHNEGPYAFYKNDSILNINYIKGNKTDGFYLDQRDFLSDKPISARCFFPLDSSYFDFEITTECSPQPCIYTDKNKILAVSDIESGFKTFRDFLIQNNVIDRQLNWTFGKGHLVLIGDFVDRGYSTTQVLWFIYKLEKDAKKHEGSVHFIIGNHELKNMYGDYESAGLKYTYVASILGKTQSNLYDSTSVLGRWLTSKNAIESINGNLFAHGGLHPEIATLDMSLMEINALLRQNYYRAPYPKAEKNKTDLLLSNKTGICWYRGYFREDLTQKEVEMPLKKFHAKCIVVGHTIQSKVTTCFNGRVIGIDVKHPKDYNKSWPNQQSEGLLIKGNVYYRVFHDGRKTRI